ncbi:Uncharacterised protein [Streptococcus pneumoniae]|nr:Uncharacterised protein [Streptococcus pneumoniae]CJH54754.1 Uncharacterised protein [Streptococcus pneumoniae]CKD97977.1 Uncharacterised protein [Streptococcus pneumoniae]CKH86144.1 Uncharacterised protein [Streptococcus pneumoniae]
MSIPLLAISTGSLKRRIASIKMYTEMTIRTTPLHNAANISTRLYPYVFAVVAVFSPSLNASKLKAKDTASLSICPASDSSAKLFVTNPPTTSAIIKLVVSRKAISNAFLFFE